MLLGLKEDGPITGGGGGLKAAVSVAYMLGNYSFIRQDFRGSHMTFALFVNIGMKILKASQRSKGVY